MATNLNPSVSRTADIQAQLELENTSLSLEDVLREFTRTSYGRLQRTDSILVVPTEDGEYETYSLPNEQHEVSNKINRQIAQQFGGYLLEPRCGREEMLVDVDDFSRFFVLGRKKELSARKYSYESSFLENRLEELSDSSTLFPFTEYVSLVGISKSKDRGFDLKYTLNLAPENGVDTDLMSSLHSYQTTYKKRVGQSREKYSINVCFTLNPERVGFQDLKLEAELPFLFSFDYCPTRRGYSAGARRKFDDYHLDVLKSYALRKGLSHSPVASDETLHFKDKVSVWTDNGPDVLTPKKQLQTFYEVLRNSYTYVQQITKSEFERREGAISNLLEG